MASGHVNRANKAEHMAAPHRICYVKIFLANSEPSTQGPWSIGAQVSRRRLQGTLREDGRRREGALSVGAGQAVVENWRP